MAYKKISETELEETYTKQERVIQDVEHKRVITKQQLLDSKKETEDLLKLFD